MKTTLRIALAIACAAAGGAFAAGEPEACPETTANAGMHARVRVMKEQMDRIEWSKDRAEQRQLMDLHMKHMREGLRELRRRDLATGCRMEMMNSMMEAMVRHEQVMHDHQHGR